MFGVYTDPFDEGDALNVLVVLFVCLQNAADLTRVHIRVIHDDYNSKYQALSNNVYLKSLLAQFIRETVSRPNASTHLFTHECVLVNALLEQAESEEYPTVGKRLHFTSD